MTPEEACAVYCRRVESCGKCLWYGKCKRPSWIGIFAFTVNEICNKARAYLPHYDKYKADVRMYPAVLEDHHSIVLKVRVRIPALHAKRTLYLHGYESAYGILKNIIRAWREMVLESYKEREENENVDE